MKNEKRKTKNAKWKKAQGVCSLGHFAFCILGFLFLVAVSSVQAATPDDASIQFFETKIRPVLADKCYSCHSASAKKLKGELYLDSRDAMLKGGESGPAIVPEHPEQSRLVEAIGYKNVDLQMPPKGKLSEAQIADLAAWVRMGAPWPKETSATAGPAKGAFDLQKRKASHWAWQPIKAEIPPAVKNEAWPRDGIDRFILAALEAKGMSPAPDADRRALIRRVYFDLTGLPPAPADVEAFVGDTSTDALAKVVDRLLASPQFGERWARHWMDLARYAETYGHEFDYTMPYAWQYRDYLIRAFNADLPYDQFVIEQIAGDLLSKPRLNPTEGYNESIIGTGFWWLCEQVHSPVDVRQHQADRIDNQIDTMGKTFLGLTLGCARCHDHKFDAISQKDVYALWGFVESSRRQEAMLDSGGKIHEAAQTMAEQRREGGRILNSVIEGHEISAEQFKRYLLAARQKMICQASVEQIAREFCVDPVLLAKWTTALSDKALQQRSHPMHMWAAMSNVEPGQFMAQWEKADAKPGSSTASATVLFKNFDDGDYKGWYVSGEAFGDRPVDATAWDSSSCVPQMMGRGAAHSGLSGNRLAGVLRSPDFTIQHNTIWYHAKGRGGQIRLIVDGFTMDVFNKLLFAGCEFKVNQDQYSWIPQTKDVGRYIGHRAHIEIIDNGEGWIAVEEIRFGNGSEQPGDNESEVRIGNPISIESLAELYGKRWWESWRGWKGWTRWDAPILKWALENQLIEASAEQAAALERVRAKIEQLDKSIPEPMRVIAMEDGDAVNERVYIRGSHKNLGEVAQRRFLEALSGADQPSVGEHSGRMFLARRMVKPANPLLPRVMVNRLWHHLFGRGIVASTDNFGVLGSPPTHPELLDFLADRFVREGWSIKRAIREMMLSRTYQMASSASDAKAEETDPQNLLLHRANVRRLEGEAIRDEILAISGRLEGKMFGPPVNAHLTAFMDGRGKPASGPIDGAGRRSIYIAVRRNFLPPMMLAFDTPIPFSTMGRRSVSNVPAQALILMNDPFVLQQAQLWANRALGEKDLTPERRIAGMYAAAFARPPTEAEIIAGVEFLRQQGELLGLPTEQRMTDERVWTDYAHVLMNLKEFIFLD